MRYLLLLYVDEHHPERRPGEAHQKAHMLVARDAVANGWYAGAHALQTTDKATTVRVRDGQTLLTDGPFAETREALGGFYLLDCDHLDDAIEFAARLPPALIGSVEIRPVFEIPGWDEGIGLAGGSNHRQP